MYYEEEQEDAYYGYEDEQKDACCAADIGRTRIPRGPGMHRGGTIRGRPN